MINLNYTTNFFPFSNIHIPQNLHTLAVSSKINTITNHIISSQQLIDSFSLTRHTKRSTIKIKKKITRNTN